MLRMSGFTLLLSEMLIKSVFLPNNPYDETNNPYKYVAINVILRQFMKN